MSLVFTAPQPSRSNKQSASSSCYCDSVLRSIWISRLGLYPLKLSRGTHFSSQGMLRCQKYFLPCRSGKEKNAIDANDHFWYRIRCAHHYYKLRFCVSLVSLWLAIPFSDVSRKMASVMWYDNNYTRSHCYLCANFSFIVTYPGYHLTWNRRYLGSEISSESRCKNVALKWFCCICLRS